jgi:hypothetical protein
MAGISVAISLRDDRVSATRKVWPRVVLRDQPYGTSKLQPVGGGKKVPYQDVISDTAG